VILGARFEAERSRNSFSASAICWYSRTRCRDSGAQAGFGIERKALRQHSRLPDFSHQEESWSQNAVSAAPAGIDGNGCCNSRMADG